MIRNEIEYTHEIIQDGRVMSEETHTSIRDPKALSVNDANERLRKVNKTVNVIRVQHWTEQN